MRSHSCPGHLVFGLPQCALHGVILEEDSKVVAGIEYSCTDNFRSPWDGPCNTTVAQTALVADLLPYLIQSVGSYF